MIRITEVLDAEGERFGHVTPDALAAVAVRFIRAWAVQSMLDADTFDIDACLRAASALIGALGPAAP